MKKRTTVKGKRSKWDLLQDGFVHSMRWWKKRIWDTLALLGLMYFLIQYAKWMLGGG